MNDLPDTKLARIEDKIDRPVAGAIAVHRGSGMVPHSMAECMEAAKMMAIAQQAVPKHLRGEPGLCLGVVMQAVAWEMDVFAVARNSFVVNDQLAYMSQLIHAVIEQRAPLRGRLRCTYAGEGPERTCTVSGTFEGENEPHTYTTPKFKDIPIKNSPLWKWDVDQQMFYFASRAWARKWCPDVLLGVYSPDEAQYAGEHARVVEEDRVVNPLGGDDEVDPGNKDYAPDGTYLDAPEKPAEAIKPKRATKQRPAPKDPPAATPAPAQGIDDDGPPDEKAGRRIYDHPDIVKAPPPTAIARWTWDHYFTHVRQWVGLAVEAAGNIDGFLPETYIRSRWEAEKALRNNLSAPLTDEQRNEAIAYCRIAVEQIRAKEQADETAQSEG
jgi:hypothetical protein